MNSRPIRRSDLRDLLAKPVKLPINHQVRFDALCGLKSDIFRGPGSATRLPGAPLFDHLVCSSKERGWYREAERLGGLQINDQKVLHRQLHRKFRRLCAMENVINIVGTTVKYISELSSVGEQTTFSGDNRCLIDRRNTIPRCQRYDQRAVDFDKIVRHAKKTTSRLAPKRGYSSLDFSFVMDGRLD